MGVNISDQTLTLVVFYPTHVQNVQFLAFLYNNCLKSQIKLIVCFSYFFRSLILRGHEQIIWTKIVNGIIFYPESR